MSTLVEEYYTPELEEFHKGFEFESNYVLFSNDLEWKPIIFGGNNRLMDDLPWFYSAYENDAVPTEFRVKYLDREDIESLGWYPGRLQGLNEDSFTLNDNQLYWQDNQFIQIYNWNSTIIFEGIIKNKSELRRLMKQLRI